MVVGGGGSGTIYVEDDEDVPDIAQIVSELDGVDFIATRDPVPGLATVDYEQIGLDHANSGDITVFVEPHWHDGDGGNFLPGNHGHPPTQQSVLLVTGGHPAVRAAAPASAARRSTTRGRSSSRAPKAGPATSRSLPRSRPSSASANPRAAMTGRRSTNPFKPYALMPHTAVQGGPRRVPATAGASPFRASLVPAYAECDEPNARHGAPLAHPSCAPPRRESDALTMGAPDANGKVARSIGFAHFTVAPGNPETGADEADVRIEFSLSDVRQAGDLSDYSGELLVRADVRITDRASGDAQDEPATTADIAFPMVATCAPTASEATGGACAASRAASTPSCPARSSRATARSGSSGRLRSSTEDPTGTSTRPRTRCSRVRGCSYRKSLA